VDYDAIAGPDFGSDVSLRAARDATLHGLCVWFDSTLAPGIGFSNAPGSPSLIYGQAFFPWPRPVAVRAGDAIEVLLRADLVGDDYVWRWDSRVLDPKERVKAQFKQSQLHGEPLSPAKLRKRGASHVPRLTEAGRIDRLILQLMGEEKPLADIAREVAAQFPARFPRWEDALDHVGELSLRYSG